MEKDPLEIDPIKVESKEEYDENFNNLKMIPEDSEVSNEVENKFISVETTETPIEPRNALVNEATKLGSEQEIAVQEILSKLKPIKMENGLQNAQVKETISHEELWKLHKSSRHAVGNNFECEYCGKKYKQACHLRYHMRMHTGEKPYECPFCGKMFGQKRSMETHKKLHTGEKRYKCDLCPKAYVTTGALKSHKISRHSDEKPYKCAFCDERFNFSALKVNHERKHSGEKPYKCQICSISFRTKGSHRKHESAKACKLKCTVCLKKLSKKDKNEIDSEDGSSAKNFVCSECNIEDARRQSLQMAKIQPAEELKKPAKLVEGEAAENFQVAKKDFEIEEEDLPEFEAVE